MKKTVLKKEYQRPQMQVFEMKVATQLLAGSAQEFTINNATDYDNGELY